MIFCFDIDGTLCTNTDGEYEDAEPFFHMIDHVNALHDAGHRIVLFTARGTTTGIDWRELTEKQMANWKVRYHELILGKPQADFYIDDKGLSINEWQAAMPSEARKIIQMPRESPNQAGAPEEPGQFAPAYGDAETIVHKAEYLNVLYNKHRRQQSDYPLKLAAHLRRIAAPNGGRLLDVGCGRGDFLRAFHDVGFDVAGVDVSPAVTELCAPLTAYSVDVSAEPLPFEDGSFDVVFSKSVIEHVHNPLPLLQKSKSALKPGGKAVIMTPSWLHHGWGPFYLDHTHVTPFTGPSLRDAMEIAGYQDVTVQHFRQLPFLWSVPQLLPLVKLFSMLPLRYSPMYDMRWPWPDGFNKLIRFSKEVMLLAIGTKKD